MSTIITPPKVLYISQDVIDEHVKMKHKTIPLCFDGVKIDYVCINGPGWYVDYRDGNWWQFTDQLALTDDMLAQLQCEIFKLQFCQSVEAEQLANETTFRLLSLALTQFNSLRKTVKNYLTVNL